MKTVLIVDDEASVLATLADGLEPYGSLRLLTAPNGEEAVRLLKNHEVKLVITDLKMPKMDGFELLAYLSQHHADIPVIVMTAFGSPQIADRTEKLGVLSFLDKPFDVDELIDRIFSVLTEHDSGYLQGISVSAFLQLLAMERKSCTLTVRSEEGIGHVWVRDGVLMGARLGELNGEAAAQEIVCWETALIEMDNRCDIDGPGLQVHLQFLIMEGVRLQDERRAALAKQQKDASSLPAAPDVAAEDAPSTPPESPPAPPPTPITSTSPTPPPTPNASGDSSRAETTEKVFMALEQRLQGLRDIKGYKASALMNFTGEILASDSVDSEVELELVGATFNDIFRSAHEASDKIGLDACRETVISTPKGIVVMHCSGVDARIHFHFIAVLSTDANQALLRMRLQKLMAGAMQELG